MPTFRQRLSEGDPDQSLSPPRHMARTLKAVAWDLQGEVVRNANEAGDFEARAGLGHVAHGATDPAGMIERDRASLQAAKPLSAPAFIHRATVPASS